MAQIDKTLKDNNRIDLNLQRAEVKTVLPEHFIEQYPNLISLLEGYYEWLEEDNNPDQLIRDLYRSRDVTQVDEDLLQYIEDELLLGQSYFGGFINKREASKFSNILYRSKGSKYSVEQFFRAFFGVDPDVSYPKENIFLVGPVIDINQDSTNAGGQQILKEGSSIGAESQRYITDDKLYQVLSILIKTEIPISTWRDVYKLFVHPAGMYLGNQLQLVSSNDALPTLMPEIASAAGVAFSEVGEALNDFTAQPFSETTGLYDSAATTFRGDLNITAATIGELTFEDLSTKYPSIREMIALGLPTFDDDSADGYAIRFSDSSAPETFDQSWFDSIGTF